MACFPRRAREIPPFRLSAGSFGNLMRGLIGESLNLRPVRGLTANPRSPPATDLSSRPTGIAFLVLPRPARAQQRGPSLLLPARAGPGLWPSYRVFEPL